MKKSITSGFLNLNRFKILLSMGILAVAGYVFLQQNQQTIQHEHSPQTCNHAQPIVDDTAQDIDKLLQSKEAQDLPATYLEGLISLNEGVQNDPNYLDGMPSTCWASGTDNSAMDTYNAIKGAIYSSVKGHMNAQKFNIATRWTNTATGGSSNQGDITTLTWSYVADGTSVNGNCFNNGNVAPSDLIAFLNGVYGPPTTPGDFTTAPWHAIFVTMFTGWSDVTGLTFVYEANDDGAAMGAGGSAGALGTRGDLRVGGRFVDGNSNVLACNYFPDNGDMIIDTGDNFYANNPGIGTANVLAHEVGHGLGLSHSCPTNNTKLMEPFINTVFLGPQEDDILAVNRSYGDKDENSDNSVGATALGAIAINASATRTQISIDDDGDIDFYSFATPSAAVATVTLTPTGTTYLAGAQNADGSCQAGTNFNALAESNLNVEIIGTDGTTVLPITTAGNLTGAGLMEVAVSNIPAAGAYFARVTGDANAAQMYNIAVALTAPVVVAPANDLCAGAIAVTCGATVTGSTLLATENDAPGSCIGTCDPNIGNGIVGEGIWYSLAGTGETFTFTGTGLSNGMMPAFSVYSGTCGALTCVEGGGPTATFNTTIGTNYLIYIDGFSFSVGDFSFDITCCDPPVAVCSDANVILSATNPGMGTLTAAMIDGGSTGDCTGFNLSIMGQTAYTCANVGAGNEVMVTLVASDGSCNPANQSTCQATITTLDQTTPTAVCQPFTAMLDAAGSVTITTADIDGGSTDNCTLMLSAAPTTFDCADIGTPQTVVLTASDGTNSATCDATVTVVDNMPPMAQCTNFTAILSATPANGGTYTLMPSDVDGGSSDVCGTPTLSLGASQTVFTCADIGTQVTVTLTATDASMNMSTCDAIITTIDQTPPTPVCQPFTAQLDANGLATVALADVLASASDNCGVVPGGQLTQDAFVCGEVGANTVTVTVVDVNGLAGNCDAVVTVEDNVAPVAMCQDLTVSLDDMGDGSTDTNNDGDDNEFDNGSTDACGGLTFSASQNTFDCSDVGGNTVTITVTDTNGNTATCTQTVTVEDNVAPVANCQIATVMLDDTGNGSIVANDVDGGSTDACGPLVLSVNQTDFDCDDLGTNTVTLTVMDANGNSSSCTATVNVQDNIAAVILCRPSVNTVNDPGVCGADVLLLPPLVIDENCSIANVARVPAIGTIFPIGTTLVTWTLTDAGGNPTSCLQNVTINDTEAPVVECGQPFHAYLAEVDNDPPLNQNNCRFPSYLLDPIMVISDNCGPSSLTITNDAPNFFEPGFYSVNYTFVDQSGNVGTCVQSVKVWDITAPTLTSCPSNIEVEATTTDGANVSWSLPTAVDNCPSHDIILVEANGLAPGNFFELGETDIQYNVYDEYGQFTECNFTVTVVPVGTLSMSLTCMDDLDISLQNAMGWSAFGWNPPLMGSNCEQCEVLASDDFRFVGTLAGHQYYAQNDQQMTFAEAVAYAENIGAEIAVLEDKKEVPMIANELPAGNYFIGLVDIEGTNEFAWINGDAYVLSDFGVEFENLSEEPAAVILNEDGEWEVVLIEETIANFVFEKVCIDLTMDIETDEDTDPQIGDEDDQVLAEVGTTAAVTYTAVDQCGNVSACGFEVALVAEAVAYCEPTGIATDEENPYFIESFSLNGYTVASGDDGGYGNHTNENFLFEPGETLDMHTTFAGPNIDELPMYCRIWMDLNNDGDFFDEGELVMQGVDVGEAFGELTIPNLNQNVENTVMRVAISRLTFAESCGDFLNGEVEDYTISIVNPENAQSENSSLGWKGNGLNANIFLYPNPAQDELFIRLNNMEAEIATLRIFNSVGQLIATEKVATDSAVRVDISAYTDGLYSVSVEADGEVQLSQKFMVRQP